MPADRDTAREAIARRGLTLAAVEAVARTSFARMPITLVDRARNHLRRFFSEGPWTVEDDAALSAAVGPGDGWAREELAPGIVVAFGWRAGTFRVDAEAEPAPTLAVDEAVEVLARGDEYVTDPVSGPLPRTLGDTFEESVIIEAARNATDIRFVTGPGTTRATGRFTRDNPGRSAGVAYLLREFDDIEKVYLEPGAVTVTVRDAAIWRRLLLPIFDAITTAFVPPRPVAPDRQHERALAELGELDPTSSRDLARILDATTSPDAVHRAIAVTRLEHADPLVVQKPWGRALEDSSRAVRRAAIRAMAGAARPDLRLLFERALADKDACVRYYALRGLAQIGVGRADQTVDRCRRDDDVRVRIAAQAALDGDIPA